MAIPQLSHAMTNKTEIKKCYPTRPKGGKHSQTDEESSWQGKINNQFVHCLTYINLMSYPRLEGEIKGVGEGRREDTGGSNIW